MFICTAILLLLAATSSWSYRTFHRDPYFHRPPQRSSWDRTPSDWGHPYPHNHGNNHGYGSSHGYGPGNGPHHGYGHNYGPNYGHNYGPNYGHHPWVDHNGHPHGSPSENWRPDAWGISDNNAINRPAPEETSTTQSAMVIMLCMKSCPVTPEYNPVCGSNGITYTNEGRLECASYCGVDVKLQRRSPCSASEPLPSPETQPKEPSIVSPNTVDAIPPQSPQPPVTEGFTDGSSTLFTDASTSSVFTNIDKDAIDANPLSVGVSVGNNFENKDQTTELNPTDTTSVSNGIQTCCCDCKQNSAIPTETGSQNELLTENNPVKENSFAEAMSNMFTTSTTTGTNQGDNINNPNEPLTNHNGATISSEDLANVFTSPPPTSDEPTVEVSFDERIKDDSAIVFRDK